MTDCHRLVQQPQVLSACEAVKQQSFERRVTDRVGLVIMPIVVTSAPLVRCWLDENGALQLAKIESFQVWGSGADDEPRRTYVVSEARLPEFAQGLRRLAREANHRLVDRVP
ncbi:hypothetical protein GCM10028771_24190 [Nocardioides marmoraquaticus]